MYGTYGTYSIYYSCTNCGNSFNKEFTKGTIAPETTTCPKCECHTAHRGVEIWKSRPSIKKIVRWFDSKTLDIFDEPR